MDVVGDKKLKRIMIVTNIPNPYRIPLFNEIYNQLKKENMELIVVFGSRGYKRRKFTLDMETCQFKYHILESVKIRVGNSEKYFFTYRRLLKTVNIEKPEKIITVGFSLGTIKLWLRSFINSTPLIIWSGTIPERNHSFFRRLQRKIISKRINGFISYGSRAMQYLVDLGADRDKIFISMNTVDTTFFEKETKKIGKNLNAGEKKILTYIGYLVKRKNVVKLLDIIRLLSKQRKDILFEIIGDGDDRKNLEEYVDENNLSEYVSFLGFKQKEELPEYLARSNCFLFQTDFDIWGLVINEAMAAGVTCISSIYAGATYDLIHEGKTGFSMDFSDKEQAMERINWILDHPDEAKRIGENAGRFIRENVSLVKSAEGFVKAIKEL